MGDSKNKTIVVTGGAGYIGRCMVEGLKQHGYNPVILDSFVTSEQENVEGTHFFAADLSNREQLEEALEQIGEVHGVIHFAALALVSESCQETFRYLENNVLSCLNLADVMVRREIPSLVFSSSCAVYGYPKEIPILESTPKHPISPYGHSKLMGEQALESFSQTTSLKVLALRYFNPAGSFGGKFGENHVPETHLIPNAISACLEETPFALYGDDYDTEDGTCIRDFIHIEDLVSAHLKALEYSLGTDHGFQAINLGTGIGHSVLEVLRTVQSVLDRKIEVNVRPRRPGDPARLIADPSQAKALLKWQSTKALDEMISSHCQWMENQWMTSV